MRKLLLSLLTAGTALCGTAQTLVTDLNPGSAGSNPLHSVVVNGTLYFAASDGSSGVELYRYDGTNAPSRVYDLLPGAGSGLDTPFSQQIAPSRLGVLNGQLYFAGRSAIYGSELFHSDGSSAAAPNLVEDLYTGSQGSVPGGFVTYNNKLYFSAASKSFGRELFSYDGSSTSVIDVFPGLDGSYPSELTLCDTKLYFATQSYTDGIEPYEYDPATGASKLLADINAGTGNSYPSYFTAFGGKIYFIALRSGYGYQLYSYNGSNVTRLTSLATGTFAGVTSAVVYNHALLIAATTDYGATYQLHRFDPSTNAATRVDVTNGASAQFPTNFFLYEDRLYFSAIHPTLGRELFMYDGTTTSLVADLNPGAGGSNPGGFAVLNGRLLFTANDGTAGRELFRMSSPTGVAAVRKGDLGVTVHPNPASGTCTLTLALPEATTVQLLLRDATGRIVARTAPKAAPAAPSTLAVPVQGLAAGTYFYQLQDSTGRSLAAGTVVCQ